MAPEYLRYDTDKCLTAHEEFSRTVLDHRGKGDGEHLRELVEKASQECRNGVVITADIEVAIFSEAKGVTYVSSRFDMKVKAATMRVSKDSVSLVLLSL